MRIVKDKDGAEWRVPNLCVGLVLDIKDYAEIDFLESRGKTREEAKEIAAATLQKLYDPLTLGNTAWVLFKTQAEKKGLDERSFGYVFDTDQYPDLRDAILGAVVDFTQPPKVAMEIKADLPRMIERLENALSAHWKNSVSALVDSAELTAANSA
jgi:hypothetical protein